jgi:hypothetical protein
MMMELNVQNTQLTQRRNDCDDADHARRRA